MIIPAAVLVAPHLGEVAYVLLALLGVYVFLKNHSRYTEYKKFGLLSLLTLGFYLVALASVLISDNRAEGFEKLGNLREFLAAPFIALLIPNARVDTRFIMLTVKFSAVLVFLVVLFQIVNGINRPGGAVNPLVFSLPSLLLGFFSILRFPLESAREKLFSLAAFSSGCMAAVISQSRSTWILSIFLLACVLYTWSRSGLLTKRVAVGTCTLFLALASASSQIPAVQQRIDSALNEYHSFHMNGEWENSVGKRIIMWESGLSAAMKKPVFGWGIHQTQVAAASELATPEMKRVIIGHNHLHNEYLTNLVAKGLPGLLSLLLLLFVPIVIFTRDSGNPEIMVCNGIGSLLCIGYALFGLTNQAFGDDTLNIFFVYFLAVSLPGSGFTQRYSMAIQ